MPKPALFPRLDCPYTGRAMEAVFDDTLGGATGWYLAGGLDMAVPFLSKEALYKANTARRGKKNIAGSLKCAYTGNVLEAVERDGLWYAEGDLFSPNARVADKQRMLYDCSTRAGVLPAFPKTLADVTVTPTAEPHEHFVDTTKGIAEDTSKAEVDQFVDGMGHE